jgi:hypothetical protein
MVLADGNYCALVSFLAIEILIKVRMNRLYRWFGMY